MSGAEVEDAFDRVAGLLDAPFVVVTAADGDARAGCLVGFHSQCSIVPLRYAVWLSTANRTYRVARGASHLAVHVVTGADHPLAAWFGGTTGDRVDTFAGLVVDPGPGGVPLLRDLPDRFVGRIVESRDSGGDHACFVLEVVEAVDESSGDDDEGGALRRSGLGDVEPGHPA